MRADRVRLEHHLRDLERLRNSGTPEEIRAAFDFLVGFMRRLFDEDPGLVGRLFQTEEDEK
jgi:hypothetical protein